MTSIVAKVFNLADNKASVIFDKVGVPIDFTNATRFTLDINGGILDTNITPSLIVATNILGELEFDLGNSNLALGSFAVTLKWYDASHANGQVLACLEDAELIFNIKSC